MLPSANRVVLCTNDVASPTMLHLMLMYGILFGRSATSVCATLSRGGDGMKHKECVRINENSDTAILFIHGILGTPNHFDKFVCEVSDSVSVYNMLLDGHGKGVKDFSKTSMKKWEAQVGALVDKLSSTHDRIYIVAHSMGTLFAIDEALENSKVFGLFLLAVPLKLFLKPKMAKNFMKVFFDKIRPDDYEALAAKECYGVEKDKNIFRYIGWIPRFFDLFRKIRQTRKVVSALNTSCFVYQSENDEMVSLRSVKYLEANPHIRLNRLKNSGHYYYDSDDFSFLMREFSKFLKYVEN